MNPFLTLITRLWRLPAALLLALISILGFVFVTALPASADGVTIGTGTHLEVSQTVRIAPTWSQLIIGLLIPLAVAIVAHSRATSELKSYLNLFLSAIAAAVTALIAHGGELNVVQFAAAFIAVIVTSQLSYILAWRHRLAPWLAVIFPGGVGKAIDTTATPVPPPQG